MIAEYKTKKLVEYLSPGGKYQIRFGHGLGDTIMFLPAFEMLRELHPECTIHLYLECGQELEWESHTDDGTYDEIFHLDFPMCEGENITKLTKCCEQELGIKVPSKDVIELNKKDNPFVAVHFQGTALPNSVNCPEEIARKIWSEIVEAGKVPIEVHFEHMFHNPVNQRYSFVTRNVRDLPAKISTLIATIQHCGAFIGVASGPFVVALSHFPHRTLYLQKHHKVSSYTRDGLPIVDLLNFVPGKVYQWLTSL